MISKLLNTSETTIIHLLVCTLYASHERQHTLAMHVHNDYRTLDFQSVTIFMYWGLSHLKRSGRKLMMQYDKIQFIFIKIFVFSKEK